MAERDDNTLFGSLTRALYVAVGLVVLLWFLHEVTGIILLLVLVLMVAIPLNWPVTGLADRGLPRVVAALAVCLAVLLVAAGVGWLVVPPVAEQVSGLVDDLPYLLARLNARALTLLEAYPGARERLTIDEEAARQLIPTALDFVRRVGGYSLTLLGAIVVGIVLASSVVYILVNPQPLVRGYLAAFPPRLRPAAARALSRASAGLVGYMWSNVIVGALEAVLAGIALTLLGVPGALVWASFTFFAEFVPRLGPYLMALPPALVALSLDPVTALWVVTFYVVMNELMGDLVVPYVRGETMAIHPAVILLMTLALASVFGVLGALVATPLTAIIKAYYEEFYLARHGADDRVEERAEAVVRRQTDRAGRTDVPRRAA